MRDSPDGRCHGQRERSTAVEAAGDFGKLHDRVFDVGDDSEMMGGGGKGLSLTAGIAVENCAKARLWLPSMAASAVTRALPERQPARRR